MPAGKVCEDYLGNEFHSESLMCNYHSISTSAYRGRIKRGYSLEEALTGIRKEHTLNNERRCQDHLGNWFHSVKAKCDYYGISQSLYYARLHIGYTEEKALTKPTVRRGRVQ